MGRLRGELGSNLAGNKGGETGEVAGTSDVAIKGRLLARPDYCSKGAGLFVRGDGGGGNENRAFSRGNAAGMFRQKNSD